MKKKASTSVVLLRLLVKQQVRIEEKVNQLLRLVDGVASDMTPGIGKK